jgi:flagellin
MTLGALSMQANTLDIRTLTHARDGLNKLEAALSRITTRRSRLGATYRQLEAAFDVTGSERESILVTLGAIRDTDYAAESTNLARNQIMSQAAVSILAQANTIPQLALQLLS